MARLTPLTKPVVRALVLETRSAHGEYVIRIAAEGIYYREKGRRKTLLLPHGRAYLAAARLEADRIIAERKAARKARSSARSITRSTRSSTRR